MTTTERIKTLRDAGDHLKEFADDPATPDDYREAALLHRFEMENLADKLERGEDDD